MCLIIRIITAGLFSFSFMLLITSAGTGKYHCGTSLTVHYQYRYEAYDSLYDFHTGISLPGQRSNQENPVSPDGKYRYEIPADRESDVLLVDNQSGERQLIYRSPHIASVHWSSDSRILLVREYDGTRPAMISRLNTESNEVLSRYGLNPNFSTLRNVSPGNRYVYTPFLLNVVTSTNGVAFLDTTSGQVASFARPTTAPYRWSEDDLWVASQFEGEISIIDPQIGDYHPDFSDSFLGENPAWSGDHLWFTRTDDSGNHTVWRANLLDGHMEQVIDNAGLESVSPDGNYALILDGDELALYHIETGNSYPQGIADTTTNRVVRWSDNGRCLAILLNEDANPGSNQLRVIDLESRRMFREQEIISIHDFFDMNWIRNR